MSATFAKQAYLDAIVEAYRSAKSDWRCCNWPTSFGKHRLNLNGMRSDQIALLAEATCGSESTEWQAAAIWLREVERDAREAQRLAEESVRLALEGESRQALARCRSAEQIEAKYKGHFPVWTELRRRLERLANLTGED